MASTPDPPATSLRDQRRAELRKRLTDTATQLFLEHGFDAVKVADVARACGVTEKTVFNHFGSKESLLVDRWDDLIARTTMYLGERSRPLTTAVLAVLDDELDLLTRSGRASREEMLQTVRFGALIGSTPALQDHRQRSQQRLTEAMIAALGERLGLPPDDPEVHVTAEALTGLFAVFYRRLRIHAPSLDAAACRHAVRQDLGQAARRLNDGISS